MNEPSDDDHWRYVLADDDESARRARDQLFSRALHLVSLVGFDGLVKQWNPAWEDVLGYNSAEMNGFRLRELAHPDERHKAAELARRIRSGESLRGVEARILCKDGSYKWLLWNAVPCIEQQVYLATSQDITGRKQVEEELRESQERFRLVTRATRDAIWDWDLRHDTIWRSEGFQTLFGYAPEEIDSDFSWWEERIHPDDRQQVLSQIPPLGSSDSRACAFEYRFRRADGSYADVFDRGFVMIGPDGQAVRMVGSVMDVSERRRAEEEATRHQTELAHIARVSTMGEIATGLAHELNQPLTAIMNYAESCAQAIAAQPQQLDGKVADWIEKIMANTHRAGEMIRRLRGFTRKSEPRRSTVELNELVQEVIDLLETETRLQNVRLRWDRSDTMYVTVDRIQIQQVLVNLLRNAYEAMAANLSEQRLATIHVRRRGHQVELAVEDRGEGVLPENRDRVFDAFFTSKASGVGIGLTISRSIVEDHGGRLWLLPNPTQGVTFYFTLPMAGE